MSTVERRDRVLAKAAGEMAAGRAWRAREILGGATSEFLSDAVFLERYGNVLQHLGEDFLAGKFYFLSGVRKAEYAECIATFRRRTLRQGHQNFVAQLPAGLRRVGLLALPEVTVAELLALGVPEATLHARRLPQGRPRPATKLPGWIGNLILAAIAAVFLSGIVTILRWMVALLR